MPMRTTMYPKSFDCPRCTMLIAGHLCPAYLFSGRIGHSVAPLSIRQARFRLAIVESPANLVSGPLGGATRGVPFTTLVGADAPACVRPGRAAGAVCRKNCRNPLIMATAQTRMRPRLPGALWSHGECGGCYALGD